MIDVDNPPLVLLIPIIIVFVAPFIYSFFVDKWDKDSPQIRDKE